MESANAWYCAPGLRRNLSFVMGGMKSPTHTMRSPERTCVEHFMRPRSARRRNFISNIPSAFDLETSPGAADCTVRANFVQAASETPGSALGTVKSLPRTACVMREAGEDGGREVVT